MPPDHHQEGRRLRAPARGRHRSGPLDGQGTDLARDSYIGRKLAPRLAALGLEHVAGTAETAVYNGGSPWAAYWTQTVVELRDRLVNSRRLDDQLIYGFLAPCADPSWWTETIAFTAVHARAPGG